MNGFPKPPYWNQLQFHQKIKIYRKYLGHLEAPLVDKIFVKELVKNIFGQSLIKTAPIKKIIENIEELTEEDLDINTIIKASHGCKWNIWITKETKIEEVKEQLRQWNKIYNDGVEKQYQYIKPQFFIEYKINDKFLGPDEGAIVYQLRCVRGKVLKGIRVRMPKTIVTMDEETWKPLGRIQGDPKDIEKVKLKKELREELRVIAGIMSKDIEFVRMDYYIDNMDRIYLSEYTFSPNMGHRIPCEFIEKVLTKEWI